MPIHSNKTYSTETNIRPKDDINPDNKLKKKYALEFAKYIFAQYQSDNAAIKPSDVKRIERVRSYAEGRQDTSIYKNWIFNNDSKSTPSIPVAGNSKGTDTLINDLKADNLGIDNINFDDVFSPLIKYTENIIGIMDEVHHDVEVTAIDEKSGSMKEDAKYEALAKNQMKALLARFNAAFDLPQEEQDQVLPQSVQEMELFENIGAFKLPYEISAEKLITHSYEISEFDQNLKQEIIRDLTVDNCAAIYSKQDPLSGKVVHQRKDILDVILEDSDKNDYSDSTFGAVIEFFTIEKLRAITGWGEDRIFKIAGKFKNNYNNTGTPNMTKNGESYNYDDYRIPTLHCFWKTIDTEYHSTRETKNGPVSFYEPYEGNKPPKNRKSRNMRKTDIRRLYETCWIIDTEEVFNNGIVTNTPYNFGKNDVEFPITLIKNKSAKSKIEMMIPIEDQIYLTWLKTQNAIAKSAPPGLQIEMGSIENITYNNKKLKPKDVITIYNNTGNIIYKLAPSGIPGGRANKPSTARPIEELRGGLGTAIAEGIQSIEFFYRQLDVITGIDGLTSATVTPSRDTGKGVSEIARASTSNTLKHIYNSFLNLKQKSARITVWMGQAIITAYDENEIEDCPYYNALGVANLLAIKSAAGNTPAVYGFNIVARANDAEKAVILEAAKAGLQSGKNGIPALTYSEYSFIVRYLGSGKSVKYLEVYLAKKEQERVAKEQQISQENMKIQAEEQRKIKADEFEYNKEKLKLEEIKAINEANANADAELRKELAIIAAKAEEERKTKALEHEQRMRELDKQRLSNNISNN